MRTPEEIRTAIDRSREELVSGLVDLRTSLDAAVDWRRWYARRPAPWLVGALFLGFVVGGGLASRDTLR
jgi:hypothetical protein